MPPLYAKTSAERQRLIAENDNPFLKDPRKGMELVASLIAKTYSAEPALAQKLSVVRNLIEKEFLALCKHDNYPDEAGMYRRLQKAMEDLEDLTDFNVLATRNVIGVGGGFSAGKSRFLNSLLGDNLLPTNTGATTAIPTYIAYGDAEEIKAINNLNQSIVLERDAIKAICHEFKNIYDVGFNHIIRLLTVDHPSLVYRNIVFLDTPGYTCPGEGGESLDAAIAREHLSLTDQIIWLVHSKWGSVPESDLDFICSLKNEERSQIPPLFLVISHADSIKTEQEQKNVMSSCERSLKDRRIKFDGIMLYNARTRQEVMGDSLQKFLREQDSKRKTTNIVRRFVEVIESYSSFHVKEKRNWENLLGILRTAFGAGYDAFDEAQKEQLRHLEQKAKAEASKSNSMIPAFEDIKNRLDTAVREVLELVGVTAERPEELGILFSIPVKDESGVVDINIDDVLNGTVTQANALGVYINCGIGKASRPLLDVEKHFTRPALEIFPEGSSCSCRVVEKKQGTRPQIIIAVSPA